MEQNILNQPMDSLYAPQKIDQSLAEQSLYESYFSLKEKPFKLTPDPKYFFLSKQHQEALAHLIFGIQENKGFVTIIGEVGTGKTTLCRSFLSQLDPSIKVAYIFNPCLTDIELLQNINDELSISSNSQSKKYLIDELNKFLLKEKRQSNKVILIIDEAQNLEPLVLEQLRLLSNLETDTDKLIQIILIGQPELGSILLRPDLRQLKQRITVEWELLPLSKDETASYIQHRIKIAGGSGTLSFTRNAISKIYRFSNGIPRLINTLADRALIIAYALEKKRINSKVIRYALKDIDKNERKSPYKGMLTKAALISGFLLIVLLSVAVLFPLSTKDIIQKITKADVPPGSIIEPQSTQTDTLQSSIAVEENYLPIKSITEKTDSPSNKTFILNTGKEFDDFLIQITGKSRLNAIVELLNIWNLASFSSDELSRLRFSHLKKKRRLLFFRTNTNLERLKLFNYPAVLTFRPDFSQKLFFLLLVEVQNDYLIFLSNGKKVQVPAQLVEATWTGDAYIFWRNFENIDQSLIFGYQGYEVTWLSNKLKELGFYEHDVTEVFDKNLKKAVTRFQKENQLVADGIVGKETKIIIYNKIGHYKTPQLVQNLETSLL